MSKIEVFLKELQELCAQYEIEIDATNSRDVVIDIIASNGEQLGVIHIDAREIITAS